MRYAGGMRVIGAGLGRTGTFSLKLALGRILGGPCYHMAELLRRPGDLPHWSSAVRGEMPDWHALFEGYEAAVDWPVAGFWQELSEAFPDALVILSTRDPERWWESASQTIFQPHDAPPEIGPEWREMVDTLLDTRFTPERQDRAASIAAFERHYAEVRDAVPAQRLLEWTASDGWEPLCTALDLPVPEAPFPHANTREEFRARRGRN